MPPSFQTELHVLRERVDGHDRHLGEHDDVHKQIWAVIERLRDRLPLWATVLISILGSLCGAALALLGDLFIRSML